ACVYSKIDLKSRKKGKRGHFIEANLAKNMLPTSMAARGCLRLPSILPPLLLLFFLLHLSIFQCDAFNNPILHRTLLADKRTSSSNQIPNCSDIVDSSRCNLNPSCRWCRSFVLDDMCFSKLEAWRLPSQVFTCDHNRLPPKNSMLKLLVPL
ncbi:hypothetical protein Ancab_005493, partial [Ancistrocladus abbreviatus]